MALRHTMYVYFSLCIMAIGCTGKSSNTPGRTSPGAAPAKAIQEPKTTKAIFFIENSESMFGYVGGITSYVEVIAELAEKPQFVIEKTDREFYFINGSDPVITPAGDTPSALRSKLNRSGYHCGDITKSNLNGMFQTALNSAGPGVVSLLISDGIYDIGGAGITSLVTEGKGTRTQFINRLTNGNLQTIIIKLQSQFDGDYFYASQRGKTRVNGLRPYYIWIFGESSLLNTCFPNEYIETLKGYTDMARFLKPGITSVPCQATADNSLGTFKFDHKARNRLNDAKTDSRGRGFQFSIAVDYSGLPYSDTFLTSPENYSISNNYSIVSITKPSTKIYSVPFSPTHLITVKTVKSPAGQLIVSLENNPPAWIASTHSDSEDNIGQDKTHTFGFRYLTNGILEAYESVSEDKSIASFKIDIR